ncbi:MAG: hypothetical protein E6510_07320 [Gemella haemolysans]|uniref:hypothetical protein n=1 Tax=Gemella haemolysans TaxID=1379 RepID=UPI00290E94AA|nr:hypothetical protein [Gemella haemolysans]MDU6574013.1 hypothetical protein [Gemella haemolysans]
MEKLKEIKSKLHLLSDEQLDIIHKLISTWKIEENKIQTDENLVKKIYESTISPIEDPLKDYSKEELLEEYGVLFYNPQKATNENFGEVSIEYNYDDSNDITSPFINNSIQTKDFHIEEYANNNIKIDNLISKSSDTVLKTTTSNIEVDDFDPLFPDTDFDSLTGLNKSKYDDLDFSALISKKPK